MALLSLRDISVRFSNDADILHELTLELLSGQRIAIVGGNGSGKSTLLKIAAGLLKPSSGNVSFTGESQPALLLQNPRQQLVCATAREEIRYSLQLQGTSYLIADAQTEDYLRAFGLSELADQPPSNLSGGQQQKLALAALLTRAPDLLLLDEPEAFLDGRSRNEFREFFGQHVGSAAVLWTCCRLSEVPTGFESMILTNGSVAQSARVRD